MIYLLSEGIQKGKTTALRLWSENRKDIGGFLTPDKENRRILLNIHSCVESPFELDPNDDHEFCVQIGKFNLDKEAFIEISEEVLEQSYDPKFNYIIIDEIGKLELQNQGFHQLFENLSSRKDLSSNLIVIVRDSLLDEVIEKYNIYDYKIISKNELHHLV